MTDAHQPPPHRPDCHTCRHVMEWGIVTHDAHRETLHGLCLRGHQAWPDGCERHVERAK